MNTLKSIITSAALLMMFLINTNVTAQSETGFPGDNFNLEATLDLFKQAASLEEFEKKLNTEAVGVNNLDLDGDGNTDYIRVIDNVEGDFHAIVLQVPFNSSESQDIAVIEIEKNGAESAMLQIVGDADIYGEMVIIEPFEEKANSNTKGPSAELDFTRVVVNVWGWPSVRFVYRPYYRPYVSPWRWNRYPRWWTPWRPRTFPIYHRQHIRYRSFYRVAPSHRVVRAHKVYTPHRRSSVVVVRKTNTVRRSRVTPAKKKVVVTKTKTNRRVSPAKKKKAVTKRKRRRN